MKANVTPIPSLWVAYLDLIGILGILQFWEARKWYWDDHLDHVEQILR